jgi:hypothetical protein
MINQGEFVVLAGRGNESHWVVLPTLETARESAEFWMGEGWHVWVRACGPPIEEDE